MLQQAERTLQEVLDAFDFGGQVAGVLRYGQGHINDTFCVYVQQADGDAKRSILQRINTDTFRDPAGLMENIVGVTEYLRRVIQEKGGDPERETLTVIRTKKGEAFFTDSTGGAWRAYHFVKDTVCLQQVQTPEQFYQSAWTFGNFQCLLADYPAHTLHETIPQFHDTRDRYKKFEKAVEANVCGRAAEVQAEICFVREHQADCAVLMDLLESGKLPLRVTHNDTKINNVLFDEETRKALVVIDLDTVMPGLVGHDFGDAIRFAANFVEEDSPRADKAGVNLNVYWAFAEGFLKETAATLTPREVETLGLSCFALACELATRFLDDYIVGDKYFKIKNAEHNLVRTRCQIALAKDMLLKMDADYDQIRYYGYGPNENYVDRREGARLGIFKTTAKENVSRYLVPQECGNRTGVRWAEVTDHRGRGLRFTSGAMEFSALPYTPHELENAMHDYELPPIHYTVIRANLQQMGVGGDDSWGARTHDEHLIDVKKPLSFTFSFKGI